MAEAQSTPRGQALGPGPPFLDAATVRAHAKESCAQAWAEPAAEESREGELLRLLSLGAAPGAAAAADADAAPLEAARHSIQGASVLEDCLNSCALFAMDRSGTLSTLSGRSSSSEPAAMLSPEAVPIPSQQRLAPDAPGGSHHGAASVAELLRQLDLAGSPPTPQPAPYPGDLPSSYGDYSSPDFTPRCSSAAVSAGPCSTTNLAAMAAAASAQMLPVAALLQQQQQQAAAEEPAQMGQAWPQCDAGGLRYGGCSLSPAASSVGPASFGASPAAPDCGSFLVPPASLLPSSLAMLHGMQHGYPMQGLCQPGGAAALHARTQAQQQQQAAWAAAAAALAASPQGSPYGGAPLLGPAPAAQPTADWLRLQALLLQHQQQLQAAAAAQLQQHAALRQQLYPPASACPYRGDAARLWRLPRSREAALVEEAVSECLVGLEGRYQPYCQQIISDKLNRAATSALTAIKLMQMGDPPEALRQLGRRYYCSLKEVSKVVHSAQCLIVAPDVCVSASAHINPVRTLQRILRDAAAHGVTVVFALSCKGIGQVTGCRMRVVHL